MGIAQNRYFEITGKTLKDTPPATKWPSIEKALKLGSLAYIDYAIAASLLDKENRAHELCAAWVCHLSLSLRQGHLCVLKKENTIIPSPYSLWLSHLEEQDRQELFPFLERLSTEPLPFPEGIVTDLEAVEIKEPKTSICFQNDRYYFQKYWFFEQHFKEYFEKIIKSQPKIEIDRDYLSKTLEALKETHVLNEEQAQAIAFACVHCLTLLCGGPGTGKTYTAGHLVKLFWESLTEQQRKTCQIVASAPTGKAAINLQKSLEKGLKSLDHPPSIQAQTLHSLLGIKPFQELKESDQKLSADFILVDESSMIDIKVIARLFSMAKPRARMVLLGDPYQLPPVEVGSIFSDLTQLFENRTLPIVTLKHCFRAELQQIVDFSHSIKEGNIADVFAMLQGDSRSIQRVTTSFDPHEKKALDFLVPSIASAFPSPRYDSNTDPVVLLERFNDYRVLSPMRRGVLGVSRVNDAIHQERMRNMKQGESTVTPIMIVRNDYRRELFNGEVGVLVRASDPSEPLCQEDFAFFYGHPYRKIPALLLPKFEYAYCLSIHKSQGSEFAHVLLLLPEGSQSFGRELLYTGVTRTKQQLQIWGSDATLEETLRTTNDRLSGLQQIAD